MYCIFEINESGLKPFQISKWDELQGSLVWIYSSHPDVDDYCLKGLSADARRGSKGFFPGNDNGEKSCERFGGYNAETLRAAVVQPVIHQSDLKTPERQRGLLYLS
jgi:hypothetical protein